MVSWIGTSMGVLLFVLVFGWSTGVRNAWGAMRSLGEVPTVLRRLGRHRVSTVTSLAILDALAYARLD